MPLPPTAAAAAAAEAEPYGGATVASLPLTHAGTWLGDASAAVASAAAVAPSFFLHRDHAMGPLLHIRRSGGHTHMCGPRTRAEQGVGGGGIVSAFRAAGSGARRRVGDPPPTLTTFSEIFLMRRRVGRDGLAVAEKKKIERRRPRRRS